jgi:hypothetical protein
MNTKHRASKDTPDTEIILMCSKYVALWHEQRAIAIADEWAPDKMMGRKLVRHLGIPTFGNCVVVVAAFS